MTDRNPFSHADTSDGRGSARPGSSGGSESRAGSTPLRKSPLEGPGRPGLPRAYWWLFSAQLLGRSGAFVRAFLLYLLVHDRGFDQQAAATAVALVAIGDIASTLAGGWLSDVFGRRGVAAVGAAVSATALAVLGLAHDPSIVLGAAAVFGLFGGFVFSSVSAGAVDIVHARDRRRALAHLYWAMNVGFSASSVLAGVFIDRAPTALFLANAAATLISGALVVAALRPRQDSNAALDAELHAITDAVGGLSARALRTLSLLTLGTVFYAVAYAQAYSVLPLYLADQGISAGWFGAAMAVNGLVIVLIQPLGTRLLSRIPQVTVLRASTIVFAVGIAATAFAANPWQHLLVVAIWSVGEAGMSTVRSAMFADLAPVARRGLVVSLPAVGIGVGLAIGPIAGTAFRAAGDASVLWLAAGALAALGAALTGPRRPRPA